MSEEKFAQCRVANITLWKITVLASLAAVLNMATARAGQQQRPAGTEATTQTLTLGGRLYDNHWNVVGRRPPERLHPIYPKNIKTYGAKTWRCSSCHGWDYLGRNGHLGQQSRAYTFKTLASARGRDPAKLARFIGAGFHKQMTSVLSSDQLMALSTFLSGGQHDIDELVDANGRSIGSSARGKTTYEAACVKCHEADGRGFIYGEEGDVSSLGWIARRRPAQVVHKIRNGVPKADMLVLRDLPLSQIADLLAYVQELDPEVR